MSDREGIYVSISRSAVIDGQKDLMGTRVTLEKSEILNQSSCVQLRAFIVQDGVGDDDGR